MREHLPMCISGPDKYPVKWASSKCHWYSKVRDENPVSLALPAGAPEDVKECLGRDDGIFQSEGAGHSLMYNVTPEYFAQLRGVGIREDSRLNTTEILQITSMNLRNWQHFRGKKLHGKRNHINKFKSLFEDQLVLRKV